VPDKIVKYLGEHIDLDIECNLRGYIELISNFKWGGIMEKLAFLNFPRAEYDLPKNIRRIDSSFSLFNLIFSILLGFSCYGIATILNISHDPAIIFSSGVGFCSIFINSLWLSPISALTFAILHFRARQAAGEIIANGINPEAAEMARLSQDL
jgi:hypothetical protein